jgi:hypothetical protein
MSDEPRTTDEFIDALIAERGGRSAFSNVQVRIAHAVAVALRDPATIEPGVVSRLLDLLPPRMFVPDKQVPVGKLLFVDHFSFELERAINACKPDDDVGRVALAMAEARIGELEGENKGKDEKIDLLERELRRIIEASRPQDRDPVQSVRRAGDNVVPISSGTGGMDWAALSAMNSGASGPYLPPDPVDPKTGRRLDAGGLPASRRKDDDAA